MQWWIAILGALAVFMFAGPLLRFASAAVLGRQIADQALAKQPDAIHLEPASPGAWQDPDNARQVTDAIRALGFEAAGTFTIPELPEVTLALLAHPSARLYAAIYQHTRAGAWFEFFRRNADGTGATFTTLPPNGLSDRPGHPVVRAPGSDPRALFERATSPRNTTSDPEPASALGSIHVFESGYAEAMAWRKQNGVSRAEVMRVASKRAA
jgi:hypothetical protein